MLSVFSSCDRPTKTKLFQSFCLSLYGSFLWKSSCPELASLEVAFNNILRKIWLVPRQCHTVILHFVSNMHSVFNTTISRSMKLISSALTGSSKLLVDIFKESSTLVYTSFGYNSVHGQRHWKCYTDAEKLCSAFIRDVRLFPSLNCPLDHEVFFFVYFLVN